VSAPEPAELVHTLVELGRQTEQLAALDSREAEHFRQLNERLGTIDTALNTAAELLAEQRKTVEKLLSDDAGDSKVYRPSTAPRWWKLQGDERTAAITKLNGWVDQIYRPMYGHLATLGPCWQHHPLCLFTLDWLSELWSALYLQNRRSTGILSSQAEFQTRYLPAAALQMEQETKRCEHARPPRHDPGLAPPR
jgi:hypothetical protein